MRLVVDGMKEIKHCRIINNGKQMVSIKSFILRFTWRLGQSLERRRISSD